MDETQDREEIVTWLESFDSHWGLYDAWGEGCPKTIGWQGHLIKLLENVPSCAIAVEEWIDGTQRYISKYWIEHTVCIDPAVESSEDLFDFDKIPHTRHDPIYSPAWYEKKSL